MSTSSVQLYGITLAKPETPVFHWEGGDPAMRMSAAGMSYNFPAQVFEVAATANISCTTGRIAPSGPCARRMPDSMSSRRAARQTPGFSLQLSHENNVLKAQSLSADIAVWGLECEVKAHLQRPPFPRYSTSQEKLNCRDNQKILVNSCSPACSSKWQNKHHLTNRQFMKINNGG